MSTVKCTLVLALVVAVVIASEPVAMAQSKLIKTTVTYREVDGHKILADVYRPDSEQVVPAIVWIHGGALIMGQREDIHAEIRSLAEKQGYALISLDYRLAPETKLPAIISDIEAAFQWIGSDGARQFHLDPNRIVVSGGSAGGYLTLTTGYRVEPRPKALVALYGYGSLTSEWYTKPSPHPRHNPQKFSRDEARQQSDGSVISDARQRKGNGAIIYLYYRQNGIWPEEVSGFGRADLNQQIAAFEPLQNVTDSFPPTLLIHGTNDTDVPYEESTKMAEQLERHQVPCRLLSIDNGEHGFGGGDPRQIADAYAAMREFVMGHLQE